MGNDEEPNCSKSVAIAIGRLLDAVKVVTSSKKEESTETVPLKFHGTLAIGQVSAEIAISGWSKLSLGQFGIEQMVRPMWVRSENFPVLIVNPNDYPVPQATWVVFSLVSACAPIAEPRLPRHPTAPDPIVNPMWVRVGDEKDDGRTFALGDRREFQAWYGKWVVYDLSTYDLVPYDAPNIPDPPPV